MQSRPFRAGPIALTTTLTTNVLNPGTTTGGVNCTSAPYDKLTLLLTHVRIVNKTAGAVTFTLYLGATGANTAGTEFIGTAISVAANSAYDWYGRVPMSTADFLVGGASANTSLTLQAEGEIYVGA
jgi:hypothetical protein